MSSVAAASDLLQLFAEPSRLRLLALLAERELSVADLAAATQLAQPRVSTHLGKLREAGVVRDQRAGGRSLYAVQNGSMPPAARRIWSVLRAELDDDLVRADRERCAAHLEARRAAATAAAWPDAVAGQMERHWSPGRTWESVARGLAGLLDLGDVLDAGSGDGAQAELLAPRARTVTCVDRSEAVIAAARARLGHLGNVRTEHGDVEDLPFADRSFDTVLLFNVLASVTRPSRAVAELGRVVRPGGRLVVVTLGAHKHLRVARAYGHRHPGFQPAALAALLRRAGLEVQSCAVTSREKRAPYFPVLTAVGSRPTSAERKHAA